MERVTIPVTVARCGNLQQRVDPKAKPTPVDSTDLSKCMDRCVSRLKEGQR